jgi:hypothetical protein
MANGMEDIRILVASPTAISPEGSADGAPWQDGPGWFLSYRCAITFWNSLAQRICPAKQQGSSAR